MKQVTFEKKETVNFEELNDDSIVGFMEEDIKRLIIRTKEGFKPISNSKNDTRHYWFSDSLKEYVEKRNNYETAKFFLFENTKEAFKWMGE